jgi:hypothetical protein
MATLFAIALLLLPHLADADAPQTEAWRAARWRMTPAEVVAAFPGEARLLSPEVKLANGNVVAAGIDGYVFEGLTFDVRFVFADGKLAVVSLRTPAKMPADSAAYERLVASLVKRWGSPLEEVNDQSVVNQRLARWHRGASFVDLRYIPGVVAIVFYPRPAAQ